MDRAQRVHGIIARLAAGSEAVAVAASLATYALLVAGMRRMPYPYPGLLPVVNVPYSVAIAGFLLGLALLAVWSGACLHRRQAPSAKAAAWAFGLAPLAFGGLVLIMSQYRHLD